MATYIPNITDTPYSPLLNTPDYAFLRYTLGKKQARYDEGLDAVSKSYNSLKKNLTDPVNKDKRDQFLKDAQSQLQKIAASDLSLAENVSNANNIFTPLATDQAVLFDAYTTDRIAKQNEIMNEWANSSDPEIRKQYNPEIQRWMNRDLDVLRNGKGDVNNYKGVQNRQALAYLDSQDILNKAAKENGFEYKVDQVGNPYIVRTDGGKDGIPSYRAFSENVLGSNQAYQRQLKVLGEAKAEDVLDLYKNRPEWQNKSDQEKFIDFGVKNRAEYRNNQKNYLNDLEKNLNKDDADLAAYFNANQDVLTQGKNDIAAGNNGTKAAQSYLDFSNRTSNRNSLKQQLQEKKLLFEQTYGSNAPNDLTFATTFAKDPRAFFRNQELSNDIQTFTNIRAASVSRTITTDNAYVSLETAKLTAMKNTWNMIDDIQDNYTDQEKLALKEANKTVESKVFITKESLQSTDSSGIGDIITYNTIQYEIVKTEAWLDNANYYYSIGVRINA